MATYVDKTHRVKKVGKVWEPQWKVGFLRWKPYELWVPVLSICNLESYAHRRTSPRFDTEENALNFLWKAIYGGNEGQYHQAFSDFIPGLVDE